MTININVELGQTLYTINPETLHIRAIKVESIAVFKREGSTEMYVTTTTPSGDVKSVNLAKCFPSKAALLAQIDNPDTEDTEGPEA